MFKNIITVCVLLCAFCVMLKLGFWQLDRLKWKTNILTKIEKYQLVDATITPLDLNNPDEFQRGYIEGRFLNKPPVQIKPKTNDKGTVGYHLLFPFQTQGHNIIVNMGWYNGETFPSQNFKSQKITGYLKTPNKKTAFTPSNNIQNNHFYSINISDLETYYNIKLLDNVLYLDSAFPTMQKPRNKHVQYAIFWFFMSGLLLFLTGFFIYRQKTSKY